MKFEPLFKLGNDWLDEAEALQNEAKHDLLNDKYQFAMEKMSQARMLCKCAGELTKTLHEL